MEKKILVSADPYDIGIIIEEARVVIEVVCALNFEFIARNSDTNAEKDENNKILRLS